jgi:hypothetical protein
MKFLVLVLKNVKEDFEELESKLKDGLRKLII